MSKKNAVKVYEFQKLDVIVTLDELQEVFENHGWYCVTSNSDIYQKLVDNGFTVIEYRFDADGGNVKQMLIELFYKPSTVASVVKAHVNMRLNGLTYGNYLRYLNTAKAKVWNVKKHWLQPLYKVDSDYGCEIPFLFNWNDDDIKDELLSSYDVDTEVAVLSGCADWDDPDSKEYNAEVYIPLDYFMMLQTNDIDILDVPAEILRYEER